MRARRVGRKAASGVRKVADRAGVDLVRDPFFRSVARLARDRGLSCVLDVGANEGQYARRLRLAGYPGRLVSVEPLSAPYARLQRTSARDPHWGCVRAVVSDGPGTVAVNVAGNSVSSSVLPMLAAHADAAPESRYVGVEHVAATTVDDLVRAWGIAPDRALLKADVQGYEDSVLRGARESLESFAAVQLELSLVPLYDGQQLMRETVEQLDALGLDLWLLDPGFVDPESGRLLQCDGVFVRR